MKVTGPSVSFVSKGVGAAAEDCLAITVGADVVSKESVVVVGVACSEAGALLPPETAAVEALDVASAGSPQLYNAKAKRKHQNKVVFIIGFLDKLDGLKNNRLAGGNSKPDKPVYFESM